MTPTLKDPVMLKDTLSLIRAHRRAFLILCACFYGLLFLGMALTYLVPGLKPLAQGAYDMNNLHLPVMQRGIEAYGQGDLWVAAAVTLLVNVSVAVVLTLLPSLIVPFIGILAVYYRVLLWGPMFSPFGFEQVIFVPHFPTVLLEGFAYVLTAFTAYVQSRMWTQPAAYGLADRRQGYLAGLRVVARLFPVILTLLVIAAIYEAYEVIHLVPVFVDAALARLSAG